MSSPSLFPFTSSLFVVIMLLTFCHFSHAVPLLASLTKDHKTKQYTATLDLRSPLRPAKLVVDLGFFFSWVDCESGYGSSSSYLPVFCNASLCASLNSLACSNCFTPPRPGCANDSCALFPENSATRQSTIADAIIDAAALPRTDGRNPGQLEILPRFLLSCSRTFLLRGLAKGATGVLGLGRSNFSLPPQISAALSLPNVFALCLSASPSAPGVAFFGTAGPYHFLPRTDASVDLTYTSLLLNPVGDTVITYANQPSFEYFIPVASLSVNGKRVPLNSTRLAIDGSSGAGGTKISTVAPYTAMETSIFKAFAAAFVEEAVSMNLTRVKRVKAFDVCFSSEGVASTREGPSVPVVDLVFDGEGSVFWRIFGSNSMVVEKQERLCLAFVDGGKNPRTSIVIGGHQLENNLLQFDLEKKRLGFSSSLLSRQTTCSNFNFTSTP